MNKFTITNLQDSSILSLNDMRDSILINPDYQRPGGVWSLNKQQLFIDSLLNRYDIPKFYFHYLTGDHKKDNYEYAIIDGRQRLESIWRFIDGDFPLGPNFEFFEDPGTLAAGMTYKEISKEYPRLLTRFHGRTLTVMIVAAEELDFIEDMFSRLNEAVPLNAAEQRNAFGGPLPLIIRNIVHHGFFETKTRVPMARYRHYDMAAKMLYLEQNDDIVDTKKASLDFFVRGNREKEQGHFSDLVQTVTENLSEMEATFVESDQLLRSSGMVIVYYVLFSRLRRDGIVDSVNRRKLNEFETVRQSNRKFFEEEKMANVDLRLIEFDELAQSANDGSAIQRRYETLRAFLDL